RCRGRHGEIPRMLDRRRRRRQGDAAARRHRLHVGSRHPHLPQTRCTEPITVRIHCSTTTSHRTEISERDMTMGVPVYERILDLFEAEGVNTLFGIPDPNFVHLFTEADARGWSVVAPHHELSAGFMAEAASRMTGKPGLCIGTLGPGVANISGAMMCAKVENSPVIFLGGQRARITERRVRRGRIQFVRQEPLFAPSVK